MNTVLYQSLNMKAISNVNMIYQNKSIPCSARGSILEQMLRSTHHVNTFLSALGNPSDPRATPG